MFALFEDIRVGKALLTLIKDPNRTEEIFKMAEIGLSSKNHRFHQHVVDAALKDRGFRELYAKKYVQPKIDVQKLARLPKGTLGERYAYHLLSHGFEVEFFPRFSIDEPVRYLSMRARECHDLWHVLAGFDATVKGELGLQGFTLVQLNTGLSASIIAAGLLHVVKNQTAEISDVMGAIVEGYRLGKRAKFLLGLPLEEMWALPLEEVRALADLGGADGVSSSAYPASLAIDAAG